VSYSNLSETKNASGVLPEDFRQLLDWEVIAQIPDAHRQALISTLEAHGFLYEMSAAPNNLIECRLKIAHADALSVCKAIAHAASPKSGRNVKIWLMPLE